MSLLWRTIATTRRYVTNSVWVSAVINTAAWGESCKRIGAKYEVLSVLVVAESVVEGDLNISIIKGY